MTMYGEIVLYKARRKRTGFEADISCKVFATPEHRPRMTASVLRRFIKFHLGFRALSAIFGITIAAANYLFVGARGKEVVLYFLAGMVVGEAIGALFTLALSWRYSRSIAIINALIACVILYLLVRFGPETVFRLLQALDIRI